MKLLRNILFWAFMVVLGLDSMKAQNLFSVLPDVGGIDMQAVCRSILLDSTTFYVMGNRLDTNHIGYVDQPWIGEFNFNGENSNVHVPMDTLYDDPVYFNNIQFAQKTGSHYYFYQPRNVGEENYVPYLCEIDIHTGAILKSKLIRNPDFPGEIIIQCGILYDHDSLTLLSFAFIDNLYKIYLTRVDTSFETIRHIPVPQVLNKFYPLYFEKATEEEFNMIGDNIIEIGNDIIQVVSYLKYNTKTNAVSSKSTPGDPFFSFGLALSKNVLKNQETNSWIIAAQGLVDKTDSCSQCFSYVPYIYSLNADFDSIRWKTRFKDSKGFTGFNYELYHIDEVEDGYIAAGGYSKKSVDSFPSSGLIMKCGLNGDSLWMKHYIPLSWEGERVRWARFFDTKMQVDGSIIAAGEIYDNDMEILRPWIIHVDENGCLVPGCEIVSTNEVDLSENKLIDFKLFPNPASNEIYIQCNAPSNGKVNVNLFSISGALVKKTSFIARPGDQMILSLEGLPEGMYTISLIDSSNTILSGSSFIKSSK